MFFVREFLVFAVACVEVVTDILPDKLGYRFVKWGTTHT
jgi:hypothetical protein